MSRENKICVISAFKMRSTTSIKDKFIKLRHKFIVIEPIYGNIYGVKPSVADINVNLHCI
jgi:hypothetical protein